MPSSLVKDTLPNLASGVTNLDKPPDGSEGEGGEQRNIAATSFEATFLNCLDMSGINDCPVVELWLNVRIEGPNDGLETASTAVRLALRLERRGGIGGC